MMKISLSKSVNLVVVSLLALVFFMATASFNALTQDKNYIKWSSPDETANYFFARKFSETGQLAFFDTAGVIGNNLLMPRSVRNDLGFIKPVSFLGLILIYGFLASFLGTAIIPFLTPLFAALGLIIFYLIIRRLFGRRVALWSAFLLATFPVYIYYTVRSMFHNVLFIVLLLAAVYLFILALSREREKSGQRFLRWTLSIRSWLEFLLAFGAGLFAGLAVITRTSELLWLAPVFFLILIFYGRRLGLTKIILMLVGLVLPLIPAAYYNQILYGSFWHGGYNEMNRSLDDIAKTGGDFWHLAARGDFSAGRNYLSQIFHQVFYFGFKFDQSVLMFRHYVIDMFPALFFAGLVGLLILVGQWFRRFQKKHLFYLISWLILGALLVFYYGSWKFNDNPDLTHFTIGNSYTRYWLPIYLGLIPLAALALVRVTRAMFWLVGKGGGTASDKNLVSLRSISALGLQALAVAALGTLSIVFVLYGSEEGLTYLYYNTKEERVNTEKVMALTAPDSVIITRYYDKFFWPERRVIMGTIPAEEIFAAAARLVKYYPVYYYNFYLNATDLNYLNERKLKPYGLDIKLIKKTNPQFGLYQLE
jgi:4-amino-4-deoxy-L-arabinose transferase-like glycosyltransferase